MRAKQLSISVLFVTALSTATSPCATLPDYEVLDLPRSSAQFTPGKRWILGNTSGQPLAMCTTNEGLGQLEISKQRQLNAALSLPILKWISGSLGLDYQRSTTANWTNLLHVTVADAYQLTTVDPVLWETIIASNMTMTVLTTNNEQVSADVIASNLTSGLQGDIKITVTNLGGKRYAATSDKPLVVAIRVVKPVYDFQVVRTRLDLTQPQLGRAQQGGLGYIVTPSSSNDGIDALPQKATIRIDNPGMVHWEGTNVTLNGSVPWINNNTDAIARSDRRASRANYVWDKLNIEWNDHLTNCTLVVTRQYMTLKKTKSGLKGTR